MSTYKINRKTIIYEKFTINGKELAYIDRNISDEAKVSLRVYRKLKDSISQ